MSQPTTLAQGKANFGTAPVFLTAISTILGAIMFLRFGYAVGHVGFVGALGIIILGHLVTMPTAMAIAEIATNQKVEGGGEYFIISRSFGLVIGAAIGLALYMSQAISVAFYTIAFAEAFTPVFDFIRENYGVSLTDKRLVSLPAVIALTVLILGKGADLGVKMLYFVVGTLVLSLVMFFLGGPVEEGLPVGYEALITTVKGGDPLFLVFAICFPAFTGMTAGVGLSGDLKDPRKSIPLGTLSATIVGMLVYVAIAYKLAVSAPPEMLAKDQLVMSKIALWGPIIPVGLAAATISSAIGSFLVAPRTLQAICADGLLPWPRLGEWLALGKDKTNEPTNASYVTAAIAGVFVMMGDVDFVAQIISMFFMVTYGSICLISFMEHFAAHPSYRPSFRSRWYVSLLGAVLCIWLMFQMSPFYTVVSIVLMFVLYVTISRFNEDKRGLSSIVQGAIFQISRQLQVFLQKSRKQEDGNWRPSVVCISEASFQRLGAFDLLRWISHRYGFGTYIHYIQGYLSRESHDKADKVLERLVEMADVSNSNVYVDTLVSPSYTTALCQLVQMPGISGKENNLVLFEYQKGDTQELNRIAENYQLLSSTGFDVCVLGSSERGFGYRRQIHVWLTPNDEGNGALMILLSYILLGHPDWRHAVIKIFSIVGARTTEDQGAEESHRLRELIRTGRLPISEHHIELVVQQRDEERRDIIARHSSEADLVVLGFVRDLMKRRGVKLFEGYDKVGNVLFVNTQQEIELVREEERVEDSDAPKTAEPKAPSVAPPPPEPEKKNGDEAENGGALKRLAAKISGRKKTEELTAPSVPPEPDAVVIAAPEEEPEKKPAKRPSKSPKAPTEPPPAEPEGKE